jgi:hypothetical protein
MCYLMRLKFSGRLDRTAFEQALAVAVVRHPLLCARIEPRGRQFLWIESPDPIPKVDYAEAGVPLRFADGERIDLQRENGLRVWVRSGDDSVEMCLQIHHCCCDGAGTNQFVEDLFCAYDHYARNHPGDPPLRPLEPSRLKHRNRFGLGFWGHLCRIPRDVIGLAIGPALFFLVRATPLHSPVEPRDDFDKTLVPRYAAHHFESGDLPKLLAAAREAKVTLNEWLLRDLLVAMQQWNVRHDPSLERKVLRVLVPFDLRRPGDQTVPAANIVGLLYVDRCLTSWLYRTPSRLLRTLKWELRFYKWRRMAVTFIRMWQLIDLLPNGARWFSRTPRSFATTVFSNVGRVFAATPLTRADGKLAAGDLVLESIEGAPPFRRRSGVSFCLFTYAGRLSLVMNYDRRRFDRQSAEDLLQSIVRQIEQSASLRPLEAAAATGRTPRRLSHCNCEGPALRR